MQTVIDQAQPYITTVVLAVVGILAAVILRAVALLQVKADTWFDAKLSVSQRELLHKIATEGFAYAQTVYKELGGEDKLQQALAYASDQLNVRGIKVSKEEIRAAIENAYLKYKATVLTKQ
ncbi:phage holin, LLH family [Paenibacillus tianjinensis]|uniref:Phage holin, LL-H family n=1 Tax=Paenibacillus tianjinensis TaxID=2810347 RepID=A0ABX7L4D2_9BACL|nr:phage holin, LLH family [Paenibacillus tianjinensis]QSF42638.1 hypothetical protein JRJ22_15075 [Paenibacillus tianjinensis]